MRRLLAPNLSASGRVARGISAVVLLAAGGLVAFHVWWLGAGLLARGAFVLFEALREWCLRACGIKMRL